MKSLIGYIKKKREGSESRSPTNSPRSPRSPGSPRSPRDIRSPRNHSLTSSNSANNTKLSPDQEQQLQQPRAAAASLQRKSSMTSMNGAGAGSTPPPKEEAKPKVKRQHIIKRPRPYPLSKNFKSCQKSKKDMSEPPETLTDFGGLFKSSKKGIIAPKVMDTLVTTDCEFDVIKAKYWDYPSFTPQHNKFNKKVNVFIYIYIFLYIPINIFIYLSICWKKSCSFSI